MTCPSRLPNRQEAFSNEGVVMLIAHEVPGFRFQPRVLPHIEIKRLEYSAIASLPVSLLAYCRPGAEGSMPQMD